MGMESRYCLCVQILNTTDFLYILKATTRKMDGSKTLTVVNIVIAEKFNVNKERMRVIRLVTNFGQHVRENIDDGN